MGRLAPPAAERFGLSRTLVRDTDLIASTGGDDFSIVQQYTAALWRLPAACGSNYRGHRPPFLSWRPSSRGRTSVGIALLPCDGTKLIKS